MKSRSASSARQFQLSNQALTLDQVAEFWRTRRVKEGTGSFASVSAAFGTAGPIHLGNLSRPPANGRWNGLFAWDEGCGGKHGGKIDAHGRCCGTGDIARPVEIGAARRSGPGAGNPADVGGAEG